MIKKIFALPVIEQISPVLSVVNWMNWTSLWSIIPVKASFCITGRTPSLMETCG